MKYKIAVGSSDGVNVNLKFGEVSEFLIYEVDGLKFKLLEEREVKNENESIDIDDNKKQDVANDAKNNCGNILQGCGNQSSCGSAGSGCGGNGKGCNGSSDVAAKISVIDDCRCILCKKVGFQAQKQFEKKAIVVFDIEVDIDSAITKIADYFDKLDNHKLNKKFEVRKATKTDLDGIVELESLCFPESEAATSKSLSERLDAYADHFLVTVYDGKIITLVDGLVTDEEDLLDEMYEDTNFHKEDGKWQMIFGVETHPDYRGKGLAKALVERFIQLAESEDRLGLVLTCKEELLDFYEDLGFVSEGLSKSNHGGVVWYQMRYRF